MNPLTAEHLRLYVPHPPADNLTGEQPALVSPDDRVRALVLTLARPADADGLLQVWQQVQTQLELPAPAIAVSGTDGFQLWFSLAEPVPRADAAAFLAGLQRRWLAQSPSKRVDFFPSALAETPVRAMSLVPMPQADTGHWSAFVAPDLVRIFADEPWLDHEPNPQAQAELLSRLSSTPLADFQRALAHLRPTPAAPSAMAPGTAVPPSSAVGGTCDTLPGPTGTAGHWHADEARQFLLTVMNDPAVDMALRIDAAKALLPCAGR